MRKLTLIILLAISLFFTSILVGCRHKAEAWNTMDKAEGLMVSQPDSALELKLTRQEKMMYIKVGQAVLKTLGLM